jgi:hypothetical protein
LGAVVACNNGPFAVLLGREGKEQQMNGLIYLVGLVVIVMFILSFFGLR